MKKFAFEGRKRSTEADRGIEALREVVDAQIVIPNERLLSVSDENTSLIEFPGLFLFDTFCVYHPNILLVQIFKSSNFI